MKTGSAIKMRSRVSRRITFRTSGLSIGRFGPSGAGAAVPPAAAGACAGESPGGVLTGAPAAAGLAGAPAGSGQRASARPSARLN
jgi:hypothetical protein